MCTASHARGLWVLRVRGGGIYWTLYVAGEYWNVWMSQITVSSLGVVDQRRRRLKNKTEEAVIRLSSFGIFTVDWVHGRGVDFYAEGVFLREVLSGSFIVSPNPNAICEPPVLHVLPGVSVMKGKFCMWWRESFVCSSFSLLPLIHSAIASRPGRGKWSCCFIRWLHCS